MRNELRMHNRRKDSSSNITSIECTTDPLTGPTVLCLSLALLALEESVLVETSLVLQNLTINAGFLEGVDHPL